MKVIQSLPPYNEFKKLVEERLEEVKKGYDKDDIVLSLNTYITAENTFSKEEAEDLFNFVKENNIALQNPFTGAPNWSRFEEYHVPSLFTPYDVHPYRKSVNSNVYWIRAVKDIKMSHFHGDYLRVKTGYKLVIPGNYVALIGCCIPGMAVINPVVPGSSLLDTEFYVDLMHTTDELTEVTKGEEYIYVAIVEASTLYSDNVYKSRLTQSV